MELILISNTKLKIMLDERDMRRFSIGNDADCATPSGRRAIRSLLEHAKNEVGFNTDGEEIFVQLYTSKKGGCELFITKACSSESDRKSDASEQSKRLLCAPACESVSKEDEQSIDHSHKLRALGEPSYSRLAFSFESIGDLCKVCSILSHLGSYPESSAYFDGDSCFLMLSGTGMSAFSRLDKLSFIREYGKRENPDCLVSYINEHGKVLCESEAIKTLGALV